MTNYFLWGNEAQIRQRIASSSCVLFRPTAPDRQELFFCARPRRGGQGNPHPAIHRPPERALAPAEVGTQDRLRADRRGGGKSGYFLFTFSIRKASKAQVNVKHKIVTK